MRKLLLIPLLLFALLALAAPNIAGTWKYNADASTGPPAAQGASLLVITQSGDALTFDYFALNNGERGDVIQSSSYVSDGSEHRGNKVRTYVTYVRAYWHKNALVLATRNIIDAEGYQSFNTENRWTLSEDGNTLTDKSSDGTKVVYTRQRTPEP